MRIFYILILLLASCSQITSSPNKRHDVFDRIITVMGTKSLDDLNKTFGKPDEIVEPTPDFKFRILRYTSTRIDAYIDIRQNKISHLTLFYFEDLDNYTALKKRFKNYTWIEEKIPDDKSGHVMTDRYLAKVPEIRMQFEYDNYAPKRKVMWIYFE